MYDLSQLDSLDISDLHNFCVEHQHVTRAQATAFFPDKPKGYVRAAKDVVNYAWNRYTGMLLRLEGDVDTAFTFERISETIYADLPKFARF